MPRRVVWLFVLQLALLTIGLTRDYQLKHEDNNALHATLARSHLQLGLTTTRGQNYFYTPATGSGAFYPNHPPGPALVLAAVYAATGGDGPAVTRATAIAFHVLSAWLFLLLARRVLGDPREVFLALLLFVLLPESAFFGRMLNHEVLALPGVILLVRGYWEGVRGGWPQARWLAAVVGGAVWATFSGWPGFVAIAACSLHAGVEVFVRRTARARLPLGVLLACGAALFAVTIAHLLWVLDGDAGYLRTLFLERSVGDGGPDPVAWTARLLELHWRYFGLTSAAALGAVVLRALRRLPDAEADPAQEVALIFLVAGAAYVAAFAFNATKHDYWQFFLLPAAALGVVLLLRRVRAVERPFLRRLLAGVAALDILVVSGVTLVQRHTKQEAYCVRVVAEIRRNHL